MPTIDTTHQTVHYKIVYYGPVAAGKASSLHYLHSHFKHVTMSVLESSTTNDIHTVSLSLVQSGKLSLPNYTIHLHLTTKSGALLNEHIRSADLQDCDGIIFVADSQQLKLTENIRKLREMAHWLQKYGRSVRQLPIVLQYNKRDLPTDQILPIANMDSYLNPVPWPRILTTVALSPECDGPWKTGDGVVEAFEMLCTRMFAQLQANQ